MNPAIPIALRLSGFLLFGIVRIYSKKVEYLQKDCNDLRVAISKAYAKVDVNLPKDANQAKYESITTPDNFALDSVNIDDYNINGSPDSHLRPNEDISITDYSPARLSKNRPGTPAGYIMINVDEDSSQNPSISEARPGPSTQPHTGPSTVHSFQDPDTNPNHHVESIDTSINDDEVNVAPVEKPCINNPIFDKSSLVSYLPDRVETDPNIVEEISIINNNSSNLNDIPDNGGPSSLPKQTTPESFHTEHDHDYDHDHARDSSGSQVSYGLAPSSSRAKRSSEPAPPPPPPPRAKRRRIKYDQATVLSNEFMKNAIDDAKGLKRKRKRISSFLDVYRLNNAYKKEKVLVDPVITGLCDNILQMHSRLVNVEQANPDAMEIERLNDNVDHQMIPISSPQPVDENTPASSTGVGSTPGPALSTRSSNMSDTVTQFSQSQHDNYGGLYDIPEGDGIEEIALMEDDDRTPSLRGTPETSSLLPRTRGFAKWIKESSATPSASENFGSVSMMSILEGKTKKVCCRMFYETLVLKSCDLVDVKQDEPYGDSKLSKLHFSN